jgi:Transposase IS116/IS110/IS902 family
MSSVLQCDFPRSQSIQRVIQGFSLPFSISSGVAKSSRMRSTIASSASAILFTVSESLTWAKNSSPIQDSPIRWDTDFESRISTSRPASAFKKAHRGRRPLPPRGSSPRALQPLLAGIELLSEQIAEYNQHIENLAQASYPEVALLKQIKGVGTLTFLLTLEDPHRFRKSRDVGCYLGLQPGRRNSGQSEPQMHISKEGDPHLRTLLVQGAQHILGPFGVDCDLRRWGLKLDERGGRNGKKRAIIATARKLAVLLHHLWVSGEVYEPLHNSNRVTLPAAA